MKRRIKALTAASNVPLYDPYFSSVVSLLHYNGPNGGTTFTDVKGKTWTPSNTVLVTAEAKFGSAAGGFAGNSSSSRIQTPDHADFDMGSGEFTVEYWIKHNVIAGSFNRGHVMHSAFGGTGGWHFFTRLADTKLTFATNTSGVSGTAVDSGTMTTGVYYHIAGVRDFSGGGDNLRLYRDGVQVGSSATTGTVNNNAVPCFVGGVWNTVSPFANSYFDGWMDDLRITKGVCRYPGGTTFTPPTAAFPDS